jgi:glucan 1,3-beta-glucosidase
MDNQEKPEITVTPPSDAVTSPPDMSSNNPHSPNIPYDPLPLTQDHPRDSIHRDSPSPGPSGFDTPPVEMTHFSDSLPSGAANPRFLGRALYDDPSFNFRDSYASQGTFQTARSAANSSVYALNPDPITPAEAEFSGAYHDDPRDTENNADSAADSGTQSPQYLAEKRAAYAVPRIKSKRGLIIGGAILAAVIVLVAVVVPVYLTVIKPKSSSNGAVGTSSGSPANPTSTAQPGSTTVVTGGDGSKITTEDGTTFTYSNPFGGTWYWNPKDPFNNDAQAQSWTKPLNQTFKFGTDRIFGYVPVYRSTGRASWFPAST